MVNLLLCVLLLVDMIQEVVFGICHPKFTTLAGDFAENLLQNAFKWTKKKLSSTLRLLGLKWIRFPISTDV